jgi:hypothetical protein
MAAYRLCFSEFLLKLAEIVELSAELECLRSMLCLLPFLLLVPLLKELGRYHVSRIQRCLVGDTPCILHRNDI